MPNRYLIALVLLCCTFEVAAQDPKPASDNAPRTMERRFYEIPPGFLSDPDLSSKFGERKPISGIRVVLQDGNVTQYDASDFFKKAGVKFPEGSVAIFQPDAGILMVQNTPANLDLVDQIVRNRNLLAPLQVEIEFSAMECSLPQEDWPLASHPLTWTEIEKLPAKSVKLLDRASAVDKNNQHLFVNHVINQAFTKAEADPKADHTLFAPGESGTKAWAVLAVAHDATSYNAAISYRFRKQMDALDHETPLEVNFSTSFSAWFDNPRVLYVSSVPDHKGTCIAIVARVQLVNAGGFKVQKKQIITPISYANP